MTGHEVNEPTESRRGQRSMWVAGLVVVAGAGVLTAHGLIEVAKGSKVPDSIAWLYPVITDGLALVAYAATTRLWDRGRAYAWSVVVLAAGLSAIAQASFLATGQPQASAGLRFAVGAWPAIAAAIAAHLLFLITDAGHSHHQPLTVRERTSRAVATTATVLASSHDRLEQGVQGVQSGVQTGRSGVQVEHPEVIDLDTEPITEDHARDGSVSESVFNDERRPGARPAFSPADRAFAMAELHRSRNGVLPSVRELATLAEVSTGTAQTALRQLRQAPAPLHLVAGDTNQEPSA